jgi:hypothetical protein
MMAAGRSDEIITLGRGGDAWYDPFAGMEQDTRLVAERLIEIVRALHPQASAANYDDFWLENNRGFLQAAAVLAKVHGYGDLGGVKGIVTAVSLICSLRSLRDDEGLDISEITNAISRAEVEKLISANEAEMFRKYIDTEVRYLLRIRGRLFATTLNPTFRASRTRNLLASSLLRLLRISLFPKM